MASISKISAKAIADIEAISGQVLTGVSAISGLTKSSTTTGIVTTNLVHHYDASLSGGSTSTALIDQGSAGYNLTFRNGVVQPTGGSPWVSYDGTNDYSGTLNSFPSPMTPANLTDAYTYSAFIQHDSKHGTQSVLGSFEYGSDYTFVGLYFTYISTVTPNYWVVTFAARANGSQIQYWRTANTYTDTAFQVTFTHDGSRTAAGGQIYINGQPVSTNLIINSGSGSYNVGYTGSTFAMGADDQRTYYYDGELGEGLIYSRELTASEVLQNWNASKTKHGL